MSIPSRLFTLCFGAASLLLRPAWSQEGGCFKDEDWERAVYFKMLPPDQSDNPNQAAICGDSSAKQYVQNHLDNQQHGDGFVMQQCNVDALTLIKKSGASVDKVAEVFRLRHPYDVNKACLLTNLPRVTAEAAINTYRQDNAKLTDALVGKIQEKMADKQKQHSMNPDSEPDPDNLNTDDVEGPNGVAGNMCYWYYGFCRDGTSANYPFTGGYEQFMTLQSVDLPDANSYTRVQQLQSVLNSIHAQREKSLQILQQGQDQYKKAQDSMPHPPKSGG